MFKELMLEHMEEVITSLAEKCDCEDEDKDKSKDKDDENEDEDLDESKASSEKEMTFEEAFDSVFGDDEVITEKLDLSKFTIDGKTVKPTNEERQALEFMFAEAEANEQNTLLKELTKDMAAYKRIVKYAKTIAND